MLRPEFRGRGRVFVGFALASAIIAALALSTSADGPDHRSSWPMIGHDVRNTRSQQAELKIDRRNVSRLLPKWTLTTAGDVSATPTVVKGHGRDDDHDGDAEDRDDDRGHGQEAVYFPDWGGMLWSVDGETGQVIWSRKISDYNGITNSISRTSPAFARGMIFVGDLNGNMMGVNARTGDLVWLTELDPNPNTIVTTSPIVLGNRLYISTSSSGGGVARQIFRGSLSALDIRTGQIIWQTFVLPDNGGVPGGFAGGAFVNPPAIDVENGLIFGAPGQLYTQPASVTACLAAAPGGWDEACFPPGTYSNSIVAFDLRTGAPRWSFRGAGPDARRLGCGDTPPAWCPPWENNFSVWTLPDREPTCFARGSTGAGAISSASARRAASTGRSTRGRAS
jgi:polyvinyl alcohol dehydrogenase (cytochrome)